ncbi:MAG TPA: c-type cytochrome biogenesis protein CcsB [bacterium]
MNSSMLFNTSMVCYLVASVIYIAHLSFRSTKVGWTATGVTALGFVAQTVALGMRWYEKTVLTGFGNIPPLSNMYESMVFWSWSIIMIYLIFERVYRNRSLGVIAAPLGFLAIASISIAPNISQEIEPLVPALQSNWLAAHVMTSFLGYAAFSISFGVSVLYLILAAEKRNEVPYIVGMASLVTMMTLIAATALDFIVQKVAGAAQPHLFAASFASPAAGVKVVSWLAAAAIFALFWYVGTLYHDRIAALFPGMKILDDLSYKMVMVGFPLLTIGIVTGAAWANYAWGTYWSWDPKETWSLITWLIYAAYLHARFTAGWRGKKTAILSVIGFAAVVFTYIGVNFVLSGLHSYA